MTTLVATTATMFDQLNRFRATNGKAPLKSWKGSRAQLEAALNKELPTTTDNFTAPVEEIAKQKPRTEIIAERTASDNTNSHPTPEKTAELKAARLANEAKNASLQKLEQESPSPSAKKSAKRTANFSAAQIIAEFGIPAKVGRALLRKNSIAKTPDAIRAFFKARAK